MDVIERATKQRFWKPSSTRLKVYFSSSNTRYLVYQEEFRHSKRQVTCSCDLKRCLTASKNSISTHGGVIKIALKVYAKKPLSFSTASIATTG